jgi:hypothetical protein
VLRRSLTVLLAVGLTAVAAGCTTFSDNDAVARVGDTELSRDTFETQLTDLGVNPADVLSAADYDAGLATSGALCLSAIVVDDEATATDLAAELDGGAAFADLFAAENLDQQLATTNGALPCLTAADIDTAEGVPFIDVAVGLDAAERFGSAPLVDDAGTEVAWVVLAFRPFAELTEDDIALISTGRVTADVHVDPRYGTFDQSTTQVVPLG